VSVVAAGTNHVIVQEVERRSAGRASRRGATVTFYKQATALLRANIPMKTIIEPFRIKMVEPSV